MSATAIAEEGAVAMLHVDSRARGLARRFLRTITLHVSVRMKLMIQLKLMPNGYPDERMSGGRICAKTSHDRLP